jgi:hypothetical protein
MKLEELQDQMDASRSERPTELIPFRVEKSELNVQLSFAAPFWPIANNIALLYSGLLNRMRDFGVTSQAIRPDSADGSLGGFNVNFWMLQFGVIVRIRLDSVELNAPAFAGDIEQLERALIALDQALRDAQGDLRYSSYTVTVGMHGRLEGIESKSFLTSFSRNPPAGLGEMIGSGTVFYFEGRAPATLVAVTADMSAAVAGGIYIKTHGVFDGSLKPESFRVTAEQHLEQGIKALGLQVAAK